MDMTGIIINSCIGLVAAVYFVRLLLKEREN